MPITNRYQCNGYSLCFSGQLCVELGSRFAFVLAYNVVEQNYYCDFLYFYKYTLTLARERVELCSLGGGGGGGGAATIQHQEVLGND